VSILDNILGSNDGPADTKGKYAIMLNAGPERTPVAGNGFNYALELDDGGYEVLLFLDGKATKWPGRFRGDSDLPFHHEWQQIEERGLLAGACGYCANAFDAVEGCEAAGIDLLSDKTEHSPSVARLAAEGYEMLTIG
jgi:hypothetical protein